MSNSSTDSTQGDLLSELATLDADEREQLLEENRRLNLENAASSRTIAKKLRRRASSIEAVASGPGEGAAGELRAAAEELREQAAWNEELADDFERVAGMGMEEVVRDHERQMRRNARTHRLCDRQERRLARCEAVLRDRRLGSSIHLGCRRRSGPEPRPRSRHTRRRGNPTRAGPDDDDPDEDPDPDRPSERAP